MLQSISVDELSMLLKETIQDKKRRKALCEQLQETAPMREVLFRIDQSNLDFEETVCILRKSAQSLGWIIPDMRDLQYEYHQVGLTEMPKCTILYLYTLVGGYEVFTSHDQNKAISVIMPMAVSVYETGDGQVEIAALNLETVSNFFNGVVRDTLIDSYKRYRNAVHSFTVSEEV